MPRTKIDWCDYSLNPVKGLCPTACSYCYARQLYMRFKWDTRIRFKPEVLAELSKIRSGSRVFIGSTIELFGEWVENDWLQIIFNHVRMYPKITFLFLTKAGKELAELNWPANAWVGVTITGALPERDAQNLEALKQVRALVRWVSFEPLLAPWKGDLRGIQWVVIGGCSGPHARSPEVEWVGAIMEEAGKWGVPIWLKNNLLPIWAAEDLIQELPEGGQTGTEQEGS